MLFHTNLLLSNLRFDHAFICYSYQKQKYCVFTQFKRVQRVGFGYFIKDTMFTPWSNRIITMSILNLFELVVYFMPRDKS